LVVIALNSLPGDNHEGDLEQVTIRTGPKRRPISAFYSAHKAGTIRSWEDVESQDQRAVVFVAVGSHANYFGTGIHATLAKCPTRKGEEDVVCLAVSGIASDYADGCGPILRSESDSSVVPPLSKASCRRDSHLSGVALKYSLKPWSARSVDWEKPKRGLLGIDAVLDPSARGTLWSDAFRKFRTDAYYDIRRPG
jgi:hypothetical protein